jgi:hypothetical protein
MCCTESGAQQRSGDSSGSWKAAAREGVAALQARGVAVREEPVLARLAQLLAGLHAPPPAPPGSAPEQDLPRTPFSDASSSRMSFSQERRCGAPPCPLALPLVFLLLAPSRKVEGFWEFCAKGVSSCGRHQRAS